MNLQNASSPKIKAKASVSKQVVMAITKSVIRMRSDTQTTRVFQKRMYRMMVPIRTNRKAKQRDRRMNRFKGVSALAIGSGMQVVLFLFGR